VWPERKPINKASQGNEKKGEKKDEMFAQSWLKVREKSRDVSPFFVKDNSFKFRDNLFAFRAVFRGLRACLASVSEV